MIRAYDEYGNIVDLVEWEKQIRANAIDDLRNELKNHYTEYGIDCVFEDANSYSYTTACNYLEDYIDEMAEQLKEQK